MKRYVRIGAQGARRALGFRWLAVSLLIASISIIVTFGRLGPVRILQAQSPSATPAPADSTVSPPITVSPTSVPASGTSTPPTAAPTATPSATATAAASATPAPDDTLSEVDSTEIPSGGGPDNNVNVENRGDYRLRVRGKIQLNHITGTTVVPGNEARAYSSCTDCGSFAVALQIDLVGQDATDVAPTNTATAVNYECTNCDTIARALQYIVPVDDPSQVPDDVRQLIEQMNDQLQALNHDHSIRQASQAEATVNNVIAQFSSLAQNLYDQRDEKTDPDSPGATP